MKIYKLLIAIPIIPPLLELISYYYVLFINVDLLINNPYIAITWFYGSFIALCLGTVLSILLYIKFDQEDKLQ